jgi:hypothetical protein
VVPTHVAFGAGSLRCGTVIRPDRNSEIAGACGPAGANQLRVALIVGAFLVALASLPAIVQWIRPGDHARLWAIWGVLILVAAVAGVASLGMVEYAPKSLFFDL